MKNFTFHFFCYSIFGYGLSGGERIFLELSRVLVKKKYSVTLYSWELLEERLKKSSITQKSIKVKIQKIEKWIKTDIFSYYFFTTVASIYCAISLSKHSISNSPETIVYAASDYWMDLFPCIILKLRFRRITWFASCYQIAPNPFLGYTTGERKKKYRVNALLSWLSQLPSKFLIQKFADYLIVNNEDEKVHFKKLAREKKVMVMLGGVDVKRINEWRKHHKETRKIYDGVFQGRFHPQKGVLELIDIWKKVVDKKPNAMLAMIGDGPLLSDVKEKITKNMLSENIKLFGYVFDGEKKYTIFQQSKIVVHPAFFDSGGMASGEAMAFGLPCIGFNLVSYQSYYPKGMLKVSIGNVKDFSEMILLLLQDKKIYQKIAKDAIDLIKNKWSWEAKANRLLYFLKKGSNRE